MGWVTFTSDKKRWCIRSEYVYYFGERALGSGEIVTSVTYNTDTTTTKIVDQSVSEVLAILSAEDEWEEDDDSGEVED